MKRIAICGAFSTGKSTLFNALQPNLPKIQFLPETAREILKELELTTSDLIGNKKEDFQRRVLARQIKKETTYNLSNESFLTDTSVIETLAYGQDLDNETYEILFKRVAEYLKYYPYTHIFYLPNEIAIENDNLRHTSKVFQDLIDERLLKLFKELRIDFITVSGNIEERINQVLQKI